LLPLPFTSIAGTHSRIFGNPVTQSAFTSPLELERHALFVQVGLV
jgi:hypothetical protein